jgi:hypothetical protein
MVTERVSGVRLLAGANGPETTKGGRGRPFARQSLVYRVVTSFSCAIIEEIVSRMDSMLRPVSVAAST